MRKIIKTSINGLPVELELINVISEDNANPIEIKLIKVGDKDNTATPAEIEIIKDKVSTNAIELIGDLANGLASVDTGKAWWTSKTVWVNIAAIVASLGATFGLNIPLNPDLCMVIFPIILSVINIILRKMTKSPLQPVQPVQTLKSFKK